MATTAPVLDRMRAANPAPSLEQLAVDDLNLVRELVAHGRSVTTEPLREEPGQQRPLVPPARRRQLRPGLVVGLAVILVLGTLGIALLIFSGGDEGAPAQPTPTSVVTTTPAEVEASGIPAAGLEWTRTPVGEVFGPDAGVSAIASGGPGFVAVGYADLHAAVWTSADAGTGTRVSHDNDVFGRSASADVTAGGPGLVAVGETQLGAPAVWTSSDGLIWSRVTFDEPADTSEDGRATWMHSVAVGGPGLVAVGSEEVPLEGAWNFSKVGMAWTSVDGFTWTQVPHDPEVFGHAEAYETQSTIDHVIAGGPGLVAVGVLDGDAAMWTSSDGLVWTPITEGLTWTSTVLDGGRIYDVIAGGPGFVAVGSYELSPTCSGGAPLDCYAAVWTSVDGFTWDPVAHDEAVFGGGPDKQGMRSVATIGNDLVAVGSGVWTSEDGISWTRGYRDRSFDYGEHSAMWSVFTAGEALIAFGEAAPDTNYVYVATPR